MQIFTHGQYVEYVFQAHVGPIGALAMAHVTGSKLLLEGAFYPLGTERVEVGVRAVLQMAREVEQIAKLDGFTELIIDAKRTTGANPGRLLSLRRRIS